MRSGLGLAPAPPTFGWKMDGTSSGGHGGQSPELGGTDNIMDQIPQERTVIDTSICTYTSLVYIYITYITIYIYIHIMSEPPELQVGHLHPSQRVNTSEQTSPYSLCRLGRRVVSGESGLFFVRASKQTQGMCCRASLIPFRSFGSSGH